MFLWPESLGWWRPGNLFKYSTVSQIKKKKKVVGTAMQEARVIPWKKSSQNTINSDGEEDYPLLSDSSWATQDLMWVHMQHDVGHETPSIKEMIGKITLFSKHRYLGLHHSHTSGKNWKGQGHLDQAWWKPCGCSRIWTGPASWDAKSEILKSCCE